MSNFDQTPPNLPPEPRLPPGCTTFLLLVGVLLLVPSTLCVTLGVTLGGSGREYLPVMLVALGGLGLIVFARTWK